MSIDLGGRKRSCDPGERTDSLTFLVWTGGAGNWIESHPEIHCRSQARKIFKK